MATIREKLEVIKNSIESCPWKYHKQWVEHMVAYGNNDREYNWPAKVLELEGLLTQAEILDSVNTVENILGSDYYLMFRTKQETKELIELIDHKLSRKIWYMARGL